MECRGRDKVPCVFLTKENKMDFIKLFEPLYLKEPDAFIFEGEYMVLKKNGIKMANGNPIRYRLNRWYVRDNVFSYEGLTQEAFDRRYELIN